MTIFKILIKEFKLCRYFLIKLFITLSIVLALIFSISAFIQNYYHIFDKYIDKYNSPMLYQSINMDRKLVDKLASKYPLIVNIIIENEPIFINGKNVDTIICFSNYEDSDYYSNFSSSFKSNKDILENYSGFDKEKSIFMTEGMVNKYGLSIGDEVILSLQGNDYKLTLAGTFRDDYGRTVVVPYGCFKNTKDEYYAEFILPSSYDLFDVGDDLIPYYVSSRLAAEDDGVLFGVFLFISLANRILKAVLIILLIFLFFSIINFSNMYFLQRKKFYLINHSLGINIDKKLFIAIFSTVFISSSIIGYLISLLINIWVRSKLNRIVKIDPIYLSFWWVILITVVILLAMVIYTLIKKTHKNLVLELRGDE